MYRLSGTFSENDSGTIPLVSENQEKSWKHRFPAFFWVAEINKRKCPWWVAHPCFLSRVKMLEITQIVWWCGTNVSYAQAYGFRKGGRNLKISAKNAVFIISSGKKQISPRLAHPRKTFGKKSTSGPPWKNSLRRPCTQACKMTPFLWKIVLYYTIWQHCSTTPIR